MPAGVAPERKPTRYRFSGARLRARREQIGLTREEIAVRTHRSTSTVAHLELGYIDDPGSAKAAEFASAVGCRVDDLLEPVGEELEALA
jgi:transcriptional regulator with XRE-family HTH domain